MADVSDQREDEDQRGAATSTATLSELRDEVVQLRASVTALRSEVSEIGDRSKVLVEVKEDLDYVVTHLKTLARLDPMEFGTGKQRQQANALFGWGMLACLILGVVLFLAYGP